MYGQSGTARGGALLTFLALLLTSSPAAAADLGEGTDLEIGGPEELTPSSNARLLTPFRRRYVRWYVCAAPSVQASAVAGALLVQAGGRL